MTQFFWQWQSGSPQPDPQMSRERAARMLRAWRGRPREFWLRRVATGTYSIRHVPSGTYATMLILR